MRRILIPILLVVVAAGSWLGSSYFSNQLHDDLGEIEATSGELPAVTTPLLSVRRLADYLVPPMAEQDFFSTLDAIASSGPAGSCLSVVLDGRLLYGINAEFNTVNPGDAMKLLTAATALRELGPDHTFVTSVASTEPMVDGVINGDIYLIGGGDPLLLTQEYLATVPADQDRLRTPIEDLAQQLVDGGLTMVTGAVVGDASRYDDLAYVPTWPASYINSGISGTLLALQFDDGWVQFPSEPVEGGDDQPADSQQGSGYLAAEDPPFFAAAVFDDFLEAQDVVIRRGSRSEPFPADQEMVNLASIESAPLSEILKQMLTNLDHETAELLLKEIGLATDGTGNTNDGFQATKDMLSANGIATNLLQFDGSGLDPASTVSCQVFTDLLGAPDFSSFFHSDLPTSGEQVRMLSSSSVNADVAIGYIDIGEGQEITFAFMAGIPEGSNSDGSLGRQVVDHLATLSGMPSIDDFELGPITGS